MAVIIGWGGGRKKDHGPTVPLVCPNCRNQVTLRYVTVTSWLRLFFIPVIPYRTRHLLVCPVCTWAMKVEREHLPLATRLVEATAALSGGSIGQEDYQREVKSFWAAVRGSALSPGESPPGPAEMPPPPSSNGGSS